MHLGLVPLSLRLTPADEFLLLSDLLVDDVRDLTAALRRYRHRGWEIVILHLIHPDEEDLPELREDDDDEDSGEADDLRATVRVVNRHADGLPRLIRSVGCPPPPLQRK